LKKKGWGKEGQSPEKKCGKGVVKGLKRPAARKNRSNWRGWKKGKTGRGKISRKPRKNFKV